MLTLTLSVSANCGIFDGTLTDLWSPLGNLCQEWEVSAVGSHYTISNVANGMVLDAVDCETADGTVSVFILRFRGLAAPCPS